MRLTQYSDYALRTLMYLGLAEGRLSSIKEIADAYRISENHLTKIVHRLGQLGVIETLRGRGGGIRLAKPPTEIGIGQILRQMEPDLALVPCFEGGFCQVAGVCGLQNVLGEALGAFLDVLDRHTLADILAPKAPALRERLAIEASPPAMFFSS